MRLWKRDESACMLCAPLSIFNKEKCLYWNPCPCAITFNQIGIGDGRLFWLHILSSLVWVLLFFVVLVVFFGFLCCLFNELCDSICRWPVVFASFFKQSRSISHRLHAVIDYHWRKKLTSIFFFCVNNKLERQK